MHSIWSDFARMIYNVEVEIEGENGVPQQQRGLASREPALADSGGHAAAPRRGSAGAGAAPGGAPGAPRGGGGSRSRSPSRSSSAASTRTSRSAATTRV